MDKIIQQYHEAIKKYDACGKKWRVAYNNQMRLEKELPKAKKAEGKAYKIWGRAERQLIKVRTKYEAQVLKEEVDGCGHGET